MITLGVSLYPEQETMEEIESYLQLASRYGFTKIFTSIFSVPGTREEIITYFKNFTEIAHKYGMKVCGDANTDCLKMLGADESHLEVINEMGIDILRMDMCYRDERDVTLINNHYGVGVEMSAGFIAAIDAALDAIEARKAEYRAQGISYYRPWLFVLTDGAPTDTHREGATMQRLQQAIENKKVTYLPMGIGEYADTAKLQQYYPSSAKAKPVLKADAKNFKEAVVWLSASISVVSKSDPTVTDQVQLPPTPPEVTVISVGI